MVYLGSYIMDICNDIFTSYYWLYPERLGRLLLILLIGDEVTYYHVDVISTGCYTTMSILFYGTLILNLLPTSYVTTTNSLSDVAISNVCKYSGIRLLQSTYLILLVLLVQLLFFLWHMCVMLYNVACHVVYCSMLLYIRYLCSNSYSVHCSTKALISWPAP